MNPIELNSGGEYIVRVNDDLSGLTQHTFRVHGTIKAG